MLGVAILLAGAALAYAAAHALRVPPIPLLLIAGLALAMTGLLPATLLEEALVLGVTFLLFVAGVELAPNRVRGQRRAAVRVGLVQFFVMAAVGLAAARALGFDLLASIYLGLALTASSTLVVLRLLQRRRQMFEPFGRLVLGVLLLQDLLVILLIPVVTRVPLGATAVATGLIGTTLLLVLTYAAARWAAPLLVRLDGEDESLLLSILALLFLFVGVADALELPLFVGAFLAGVSISVFPVSAIVRSQLNSIGDFFSAVFFTALGALIGLPSLAELGQALALAAIVIVITPPIVATIAERAGFSARPAIEAGLLLSQTSELSLVIGLYGMLEGQIAPGVFTIIALVTVGTIVVTPFLTTDRVVWQLMRLHPVGADGSIPPSTGGHVLVLGAGTTGTPLIETLLGSGHEVVVVDDDPTVISRLREADVLCLRGDASDTAILEAARARQARIITSTIRRPEDNRRLLEYVRGVPTLVRVFDHADARWVREMGGIPMLYSGAAAEAMLHWFERFEAARADRSGTARPPPEFPTR